MLTKEEEVKHSIILLQDATNTLFEKIKSKNIEKEEAIKVESAFLRLIGVVTTGIFKDYKEYKFYCKIVQKEISDHFEKYLRENE